MLIMLYSIASLAVSITPPVPSFFHLKVAGRGTNITSTWEKFRNLLWIIEKPLYLSAIQEQYIMKRIIYRILTHFIHTIERSC